MTGPTFPVLKKKFEGVSWETVCPFLLNDDDGTKTKEIDKNHRDVSQKCDEMLIATVFKNVQPNLGKSFGCLEVEIL